MWSNFIVSVLLPSIASASMATATPAHLSQPSAIPSITQSEPRHTPSISTIPSDFTIPTTTTAHAWDPLISGASYLVDEISEHLHIDLRKRQGGAGIVATAPVTTAVTQMPPITVYDMYDGVPRTYTQLFVAVPDQWSSPSAGSIGLGTIKGEVGVVKTKSKRSLQPPPTSSPGHTLRIRGREVIIPR